MSTGQAELPRKDATPLPIHRQGTLTLFRAGHSKWANIQHRKGAQDKKRAVLFSRLSKEITIAVKIGGEPDPDANPRLRLAIKNARGESMPKDNIKRAMQTLSLV